ncbi:MAG: nickel-dependent lactate racemase [Candidatus Cloacimonadota bacterium]|nr:nickel-dependent lactate racemase [Candidatus Cloacimonadota bacterium]
MNIKLKYGKGCKELKISSENIIDVLEMKEIPTCKNPYQLIKQKLNSAIGTESLSKLLEKKMPKNIVVIISDITRPGPFEQLLKPLVDEILATGIDRSKIRFVIANGTHRKMTDAEMRFQYGNWIVDNFSTQNHDCRASNLVSYGKMESGNELKINKTVANADFLITTGILNTHYFAGFGGGRKSILPGVCGYETIRRNHSNIIYDYARLGNLEGNLIHLEMCEAAEKVGVDFCVNMLINAKKQLVNCFAGDIDKVFHTGAEAIRNLYSVKFSQYADVVITSAGGYPKDINFYQSQKALNNIIDLVKDGATIVMFAECKDGVGQDEMERVLASAKNLDELFSIKQKDIQIGGHRAFATGKLLKKADILVISSMKPEKVRRIHFIPMKSFDDCIDFIIKKHGKDFSSYIVPNGSMFFPIAEIT